MIAIGALVEVISTGLDYTFGAAGDRLLAGTGLMVLGTVNPNQTK